MIILVGPSASGKTEVAKMLGNLFKVKKVVTHTTRDMRPGEINGIDYHFVNRETFNTLNSQGVFAETTEYNHNFYGTSKKEIADNKVLIVDPNGLTSFKAIGDSRIICFFMNASRNTRKKRMIERGDEPTIALQRIVLDDAKFDPGKIKGIDYIIDSEKQSIQDVTIEVYEKYALKLLKL